MASRFINLLVKTVTSEACQQRSLCYRVAFARHISSYFASINNRLGKPRKPMSAYLVYLQSIRFDLIKQYPDLHQKDLVKIAATMYRNLSDEEKTNLIKSTEAEFENYSKEMKAWLENLSEEEKKILQEAKREKMIITQARNIKVLKKKFNKPSKPPNGFIVFYTEVRKTDYQPDMPYDVKKPTSETMKKCKELWDKMTPEEKQSYACDLESKSQYEALLLEWERDMLKQAMIVIALSLFFTCRVNQESSFLLASNNLHLNVKYNKPKRPSFAFNAFFSKVRRMEYRQDLPYEQKESIPVTAKKCKKLWHEMEPFEKQCYQKSDKLTNEYEAKLLDWERGMFKQGWLKLVRKKSRDIFSEEIRMNENSSGSDESHDISESDGEIVQHSICTAK